MKTRLPYHSRIPLIDRFLLWDYDIQSLPYILFQPSYIHTFCPLGVVDKLWSDTSSLALSRCEQILFASIIVRYTTSFTIVPRIVIETWSEIVFMEELSIERDVAAIC